MTAYRNRLNAGQYAPTKPKADKPAPDDQADAKPTPPSKPKSKRNK